MPGIIFIFCQVFVRVYYFLLFARYTNVTDVPPTSFCRTAFVRQGSVLDVEALHRGTTVYLVDRRLGKVDDATRCYIMLVLIQVDSG